MRAFDAKVGSSSIQTSILSTHHQSARPWSASGTAAVKPTHLGASRVHVIPNRRNNSRASGPIVDQFNYPNEASRVQDTGGGGRIPNSNVHTECPRSAAGPVATSSSSWSTASMISTPKLLQVPSCRCFGLDFPHPLVRVGQVDLCPPPVGRRGGGW